jgi:L-alanine-DL-glutamate epimerase-like enolase superfamily enzyme
VQLRHSISAGGRHAAILLAGVGLRAHSLVDLAAYDLWAREEDVTVAGLLGHDQPPRARVRAIVGYPPSAGPDAVADQVRRWGARGVASFKLPVAVSRQLTVERVAAALQEAPEAVVGLDLAWSGSSVDDVLELLSLLPTATAFIEDPFMPGQIADLEDLARVARLPVQVGDEDGGPYYPGVILDRGLPVGIRLDATCMGGVSGLSGLAGQFASKPPVTSWHMNSRIHLQLSAALGLGDGYVELSCEGDGVDPFEEGLPGLTVEDGVVSVPKTAPGFALPPLPVRPWRPPT